MAEKPKNNRIEPRTLKGFRDFLPEEQIARQRMIESIRRTYELFGFSPIETPTIEYADILTGKYGEEGEKLMYRFKDNGDRDVALRYDLTVPLARLVAQYGEIKKPFKRYQIANVFRAENTQKGRYREFCQCDADIVGSESINADAEILALTGAVLENLGLKNYEIRVNDRRLLDEYFDEKGISKDVRIGVLRIIDKFDKVGEKETKKMLIEVSLSKTEADLLIFMLKNGFDKSAEGTVKLKFKYELEKVITLAKKLNPRIKISPDFSIARGLDYYTGMIFEVKLLDAPQFGTILAGGRYDNLIGTFANKNIPAVGMSVGIDRLFFALQELKLVPEVKTVTKVLAPNAEIAAALRAAAINTEVLYDISDFKKTVRYAEDRGIPFVIIVDESEAKENKVKLIDMKTGDRKIDTLEKAVSLIKSNNG